MLVEINAESTSVVWPALGSRTAEEQNRTVVVLVVLCVLVLVCAEQADRRAASGRGTASERARAVGGRAS